MPQPVLHLRIARRTLERWRRQPDAAPFAVDAPGVVDHFVHGALAPDMGLFPGGSREISRLVHTERTGEVVRALERVATTDAQRAFAWGWLTHVLADAEIHPIVNEHADRLLEREGVQPDGRARGRAHVRVELGLDAWHLGLDPDVRRVRVRRLFDARRIRFLADALHATYSRTFPAADLLRCHGTVTRFVRPYLLLADLIAGATGGRQTTPLLRLGHLRPIATRLLDGTSQASGFVAPVPASAALIEHTESALSTIVHRMDAHVAQRLRHLADIDLETGAPLQSAAAA